MSRSLITLALALALGVPSIARAEDGSEPDEISLDALLERAAQSPRVRVEAALAEAARGDVRTAGQHPNPTLSYGFAGFLHGVETNGGTQQDITLTQPLLWPGQLDSRVAAARAQLELSRAHIDVLRGALAIELRRSFVALLAAQERSHLLAEVETSMEALAQIVRGRAEAGAGRRWDVMRIDGELASIQAARDAARAEEAEAAGRLGMLVGSPTWFPRAAGSWADLGSSSPPESVAEEHPALAAARLAREAALARVRSERAFAIPAIELSIGTIISTAPEGGYLYGGIAMPLPFFDANQGQIERAEREADAAELADTATRVELASALARARRVLAHRREALASFEHGVVGRLPELAEMAQVAYQGGEVSVFELLDAVRASRELQVQRVDREEAVRLAEIDVLEAALGRARGSVGPAGVLAPEGPHGSAPGARTEGPAAGEPISAEPAGVLAPEGPHGSAPGARTGGPGAGEPVSAER